MARCKVKASSRQAHGKVKARQGQSKVKEGQDNVKARSNFNLMRVNTIEIYLVELFIGEVK